MLRYAKFRQDLLDPQPAREVYIKRPGGRGWPEECPPLRSANAFGFDILANFTVTFIQSRGRWRVEPDLVIDSDFEWAARDDASGVPLRQQYAWFWEKGQTLPHVISDDVWKHINNQVKVSSFLFMRTDPDELLFMTEVPNLRRPWRAMSALIETDWYPASYPWHCVLELDRDQRQIRIEAGEPLCRLIPVRRGDYRAGPMMAEEFEDFFERGQRWLATHGRVREDRRVDITRTYVKQMRPSRFELEGPRGG